MHSNRGSAYKLDLLWISSLRHMTDKEIATKSDGLIYNVYLQELIGTELCSYIKKF